MIDAILFAALTFWWMFLLVCAAGIPWIISGSKS